MKKYKVVFFSILALILIFVCLSCGAVKDIDINYDYPNFVKDEPLEVNVGDEIRFIHSDDYGYLIEIKNANEFLETNEENLKIAVTYGKYISNTYRVINRGTGEYYFTVLCLEKAGYNAMPSSIIIKSEE